MLKTANDLSAYTLAAGEPFFLEVQFQDSTGAVLDLTERAFVLSFYRDDRSTEEAIDGEQLVDATGRFLRFARDGRFSENLYGLNLMVELAERYLNGRSVVTFGRLTVERSAAGVPSFGNGIVAKYVTRVTVKDNAVLGGPPAFTQQQLLYRPDVLAPPVTLGELTLSGTLTVGVASSGAVNGATTGSTVSESVVGLTVNSSARTYEFDGSGGAGTFPGGMVETHPNATNSGRASSVTIVAAPVAKVTITGRPATTGQVGTPFAFAPGTANGSGPKVFSKNIALLPGQTFSTTTGAIGGTPTQSGTLTDLVITVTDDTGSASTTATTVTIAAAPSTPSATTVTRNGSNVTRNGAAVTRGTTSSGGQSVTYADSPATYANDPVTYGA